MNPLEEARNAVWNARSRAIALDCSELDEMLERVPGLLLAARQERETLISDIAFLLYYDEDSSRDRDAYNRYCEIRNRHGVMRKQMPC